MEELRIWPWPEDSTSVPSVWVMPRPWSRFESDLGRSKFSPGVPSAKSSPFQCAESAFSPGGGWGHQRAHRVPSLGGSEALQLSAEQAVSRVGLAWARGLPPIKGGITRRSLGVTQQVRSRRTASPSAPPARLWIGQVTPGPCPPLPGHLYSPLSKSWTPEPPKCPLSCPCHRHL